MTDSDRIAVITPVSGRQDHLRRQEEGLRRGTRRPDVRVIAAMGARPRIDRDCRVLDIAVSEGLPLARARNQGAQAALDEGADVLVFLDVDCIPGAELVGRYARAATAGHGLMCGGVSYLPPPPIGGYDMATLMQRPIGHPARPVPPEDGLLRHGDHRLFWSLSFALTAADWARVGGFCEQYVGYGGEDTDFGQAAAAAGVEMTWVGGAWAFHQYHPTEDPPVQHLDDILRNAAIFQRRWGWWPMRGWLDEFARRGLARFDPVAQTWVAGQASAAV